MAGIVAKSADAVATKCSDILIDKVMKELPYMCCYNIYVADFEEEKEKLKAAVGGVNMKIEEARKRNETQIDPIVEQWVKKANKLIQQETTPKKWFSRYSLAKKWEMMTQEIPTMMEKAENFSHVAHAAERPGMEFYSQEFMHFKSRNSVFEQLMEDLKDGNTYRIGLQAMGGSGKTTMAKAVGKELENSQAFDKVIFIEVPNPVDEKKIRDEIEKKLDLKIDDDSKENLTHAEQIWIRIANAGKVLIILDDVWEELNLENIGIHHGIHTEGRCCILLTTRYETVCKGMRCQKTINLEVLPEEDAVDLFLYHASESGNDCTYKSKLLASKIVNECGRLPVIIVAVAKTFRNWVPNEWEDALAATETDSSLRHGNTDEEANKFYNSLKRSFECLDPRAQDLISLCSIFPRAYEIPVELLSRIAIGSGLCGNVDSYCRARSQVLSFKTKLVSSALLLPTGEGFVKMHDVIRDVAQQIVDEKIQVIMDSNAKFEENAKYSSWMIDDFSNYFGGNNLEVLLVWVNANASLEVPNEFFRGMKGLRVLLLSFQFKSGRRVALSLPKSIHSLENIQTLSLTNWELGDISILQNLKELQSLELANCSILEVPNDVSQLKKLRLLRLAHCSIKKNNPFEVIGRCLKLEVLYYVSNDVTLDSNAKSSKIIDLQEFGIYHIEASSSFRRSFQLDASTKRYFNSTKLSGILSKSTIKSLAARAEILKLTECNETRWTNLIPDMVHPIEDGGMNDLIRLSLKSCPAMQCLIHTNGIPSDAAIFSNLVELQLHDMPMRELCHGDFPIDFLKKLEKLNLNHCDKLDGTLFKAKLELSNLESVKLVDCSMTCLFHLSTAQSLRQLQNLYITRCSKLKCLISYYERAEQKVDDHQDPNQKYHHSVFLKLKFLNVRECHELDFILPISPYKELESVKIDDCKELNYIFGQCPNEGGLYQMEKETILPLLQKIKIANVPKFINIYPEYHLSQPSQVQKSWGPMCCFSLKASALNIDEQSFSKANQLNHTQASKEKHLSRVGGLLTPPLYPFKNLRKMTIEGFSELKSLLTLSIASSLKLIETLKVNECSTLEHIITDERPNSYGHMNVHSIFPNLQQVYVRSCKNLEYVFPAFYSRDFKCLEHVSIQEAGKMKYVFGKCRADEDHNVQSELALPALKEIWLDDVLNMASICTKNYHVKALSLEDIELKKCPQLPINSVMDLCVDVQKTEDLSKRKEKEKQEYTCLYVTKASKAKSDPSAAHGYFPPSLYQFKLREIKLAGFSQLTSLFTISIASSLKLLETLEIEECDALQHLITDEGPNSHDQMIVPSFFPRLRFVYIKSCNNLEYVFPAFYSKDFKDLKVVGIWKAKRIKYVFGKCHADQDHNVQSRLNFPALRSLTLDDVQNMVSICAENYYVEVLHLDYFVCTGCPQPPQPFMDFLFRGHKRQDLSTRKALSFKERGKPHFNLQELCDSRDIYLEPKNFLSFQNLSWLRFEGCKQLQFILSASTVRSMPKLRDLLIADCEELVSIIEDDEQNQQNPLDLQQACFPMLRTIRVKQCKKLKYLFSISTCPKLPRLRILNIEDAPELAQVFEWKQGTPQELVMKDVLPNLLGIRLVNLPSLDTIYQGIDFQTLKVHFVRDCGNIPSDNISSSELFDFQASLRYKMKFLGNDLDTRSDYDIIQYIISQWAHQRRGEEESEKTLERDKTISEQNNSFNAPTSEIVEEKLSTTLSSNSNVNTETSKNEIVEEQLPTSNAVATSSSKSNRESKGNREALGEDTSLNEGPQRVKVPANDNVTKETAKKVALAIPHSTTTLDPSICNSKKPQTTTSITHTELKISQSERIDISITTECPQNLKATFGGGPSLEKYDQTSSSTYSKTKIQKPYVSTPPTELCGKESMDDQQALGESRRSNETPQRVEQPGNIECSSKNTSKERTLTIPPSITETTSPQISLICSPKKLENATSAAHAEIESGSSDIIDQYAQSQIVVNQRETSIEDDLTRLFCIMRDGSDMEVSMSCVSNIAALEDDKVAKAFSDIESSLKMDLYQIAISEEHTHRLENALNFLSSHFSVEGPSSHGLVRRKIEALHQEIQRIISSFKQSSDTLDTFTKLKEKEKWMDEQHSQRLEAATTLVSEIRNTEDYMNELKQQICRLQEELKGKEKEFEEYEIKLSSLQKQKKECVWETIEFMEQYEAVKKDKSYVGDGQTKARQEIKKLENQWPSCVADLRKTSFILGILLKYKP
ncbi:hypothetical protein QN277_009660 [Acacia crassicarpa]|uniref:Disease resistance protein n=1 Tax=Acacia crassicarpa TaxID=499986 RepID=A0AAE1INJ6_9FABA|nr:hypothetical protein QN277_009660 [Acacia crassicarpa]